MSQNLSQRAATWEQRAILGFCSWLMLLALIQVGITWSGLAGLVVTRPLAISYLVISVVAAALFCRWAARAIDLRPLEKEAAPRDVIRRLWHAVVVAVGLATGFLYVSLCVLAWLRPPYSDDGLMYHLPAIHTWAVAGRLCWPQTPPVITDGWSMGMEALVFFLTRVFPTDRVLVMGNLFYLPLGSLAMVLIAVAFGARGAAAWLAGALWIWVPVSVGQGASLFCDAAYGSCVAAVLASSLLLVLGGGLRTWSWPATLLWGAAVGLMVGCKGSGVIFAAVFGSAVLVVGILRRGRTPLRAVLLRFAAAVVVAYGVGGYWMTRNYMRTGNPAYPVSVSIGAWTLFPGRAFASIIESPPPELRSVPARFRWAVPWFQPAGWAYGFAPRLTGMGYLWICGALPCVFACWLMAAGRSRGVRVGPVVFASFVIVVLFALTEPRWWARFTVWIYALGLPCLALAAHNALYLGKRRALRTAALVALCALLWLAFTESRKAMRHEWRHKVRDRRPGEPVFRSSLEAHYPELARNPAFRQVLAEPQVARGSWSFDSGSIYLDGILGQPLGKRKIHVLPAAPKKEDVARLRNLGVRWVLWDPAVAPLPEAVLAAAEKVETVRDTRKRIDILAVSLK